MKTHTFDTLKAVKRLTKAGMKVALAEALVEIVADAIGKRVATKDDVESLGKELRREFHQEILVVRKEMESMVNRTVIRLGGVVIGCTIALGIFVKL